MLNLKNKINVSIIVLLILIASTVAGVFIIQKVDKMKENYYSVKLIEIIDKDLEGELTQEELENYEIEINKELENSLKESKESFKIKQEYYALGAIKYLKQDSEKSIEYLGKALEYGVIESSNKDLVQLDVRIYSALSSNYILLKRIEESDVFFERAKTIALKNDKKNLLCELYYGKAKSMETAGYDINISIDLMRKALEYGDVKNHKIRNYLYLSKLYKLVEEFELALEYTINALDIAMKLDDSVLIENCVISLGESYYVQGNYSKTIYIYEGYLLENELQDDTNKLTLYGYLAECYANEGHYANYKMYREKYMDIVNDSDNVNKQVWIYVTSADIELKYANVDTAKEYLNKAKDTYDASEDYKYAQNTDVMISYVNTKIDYYEDLDYKKALNNYESNLEKLSSRGVKSDVNRVIINEVLKISFENNDFNTYKKYKESIDLDKEKSSQTYIDSIYAEINNNVKEKRLFKEQIKTLLLLALSIISIYGVIRSRKRNKRINELNNKLKELNTLDPLTNVYNKGYLMEQYKEILKSEDLITTVMIDIDFFKQYNDNYGHIKGDQVLSEVATIMKQVCKEDKVFRYGGEEFLIISNKTVEEVIEDLEEIKIKLHSKNIVHEYSEVSDRVTLSIGIASNTVKSEEDLKELTKLADENLYKSKKNGRDRYTF